MWSLRSKKIFSYPHGWGSDISNIFSTLNIYIIETFLWFIAYQSLDSLQIWIATPNWQWVYQITVRRGYSVSFVHKFHMLLKRRPKDIRHKTGLHFYRRQDYEGRPAKSTPVQQMRLGMGTSQTCIKVWLVPIPSLIPTVKRKCKKKRKMFKNRSKTSIFAWTLRILNLLIRTKSFIHILISNFKFQCNSAKKFKVS